MLRRIGLSVALVVVASGVMLAQISSRPDVANQTRPAETIQAKPVDPAVAPSVRTIVTPAMLATMTAEQTEKIGDEMREKKEFLQAIDAYDASLKKKKTASVLNKMGMTYLSMGQLDKAKDSLKKATKSDKKYADAYNNLGVVYYIEAVRTEHKGRPRLGPAIKQYKKSLALKEDSASAHSNLGTAYIEQDDMNKGIAEYRRAFELDPSIFERSSRSGVAAKMSSPEDKAQFAFLMAKMYAGVGNNDLALQYLRKAIEEGYDKVDDVYKQSDFAKLREDQRFAEMMKDRPASLPQ